MKRLLITGGAGFVGSSLAILFKQAYPDMEVIAFDNLKRRGSELSLVRLRENGVCFVHGDVRSKDDLFYLPKIDIIIDCAAEPSVLAGNDGNPEPVIGTNLFGTINSLELARRDNALFLFLSTSRVYPVEFINSLNITEKTTRFELSDNQTIPGAGHMGISEDFPVTGIRSLYGATKLASELIIQEYMDTYSLHGVINRCGIIAGPWQMGKIDQGVMVYWAASHIFGKKLRYFGYGGSGKQVRDILHIRDLFALLTLQINSITLCDKNIFTVGGGYSNSISLWELSALCRHISGCSVPIESLPEERQNDIKIYISDTSKVTAMLGWKPTLSPEAVLAEIIAWIVAHKTVLEPILA
jgi:CDP-paratose 2-epimerase